MSLVVARRPPQSGSPQGVDKPITGSTVVVREGGSPRSHKNAPSVVSNKLNKDSPIAAKKPEAPLLEQRKPESPRPGKMSVELSPTGSPSAFRRETKSPRVPVYEPEVELVQRPSREALGKNQGILTLSLLTAPSSKLITFPKLKTG